VPCNICGLQLHPLRAARFFFFWKFGSIPLKDHHFGSIPLLFHLHVGPHESMTCGVYVKYLKFGSFNEIDPIVLFFFFSSSTTRSREHTRTHGTEATSPQPSSVSRLLLVPTHPHSQGRPLDSPSSPVQPDQSPSPPPQGAASRRSELESGPSSPHHKSGKYTRAIKIHPSPRTVMIDSCLPAPEFLPLFSLAQIFMLGKDGVLQLRPPKRAKLSRPSPHTHNYTNTWEP
jgi:hypothetical protein